MPRITSAQAAEKWARRTAAAGQDYVAGIQRVTESPGAAAARNIQGYINGVTAAVQNGKTQAAMAAVQLPDWQRAAVEKGAPRLAQGATAAQPKMQAALDKVFPMIDNASRAIANMDRSTPEARIQRSAAFQTAMMQQARRGR